MVTKIFSTDPITLIIGILLILSGFIYIFNNTSWGLLIASIGLLIEALRKVI